MAKVTKTKAGILRVVCDCGRFIHEIYKDGDQIQCETFEQKKDDPPAPPAPPASPSKKRSKDIFEDDEEN